jgi:hypothetical protein
MHASISLMFALHAGEQLKKKMNGRRVSLFDYFALVSAFFSSHFPNSNQFFFLASSSTSLYGNYSGKSFGKENTENYA